MKGTEQNSGFMRVSRVAGEGEDHLVRIRWALHAKARREELSLRPRESETGYQVSECPLETCLSTGRATPGVVIEDTIFEQRE